MCGHVQGVVSALYAAEIWTVADIRAIVVVGMSREGCMTIRCA